MSRKLPKTTKPLLSKGFCIKSGPDKNRRYFDSYLKINILEGRQEASSPF